MQKQLNKPTTGCREAKEYQEQQQHDGQKGKKYLLGPVATVFASTKTGSWRVVRPVVNQELCTLCGTCQKYCPTDIVDIVKAGEQAGVFFDFDYCKGCGICANVCPKKCIQMISERGEQA